MFDDTSVASAAVGPLPFSAFEESRIRMTCRCRDCDGLPKVANAGATFPSPQGRCQLMHNGVRVIEDCYYGPWMTELIRLLRGHHEPQEERAFHEVLRHVSPGAAMLELGSFWGYYSLWFQRQIPAARNYLIEPDPHNLETGKRNFGLNDADGEFFQACLGRQSRSPAPFVCESDKTTRPIAMVSVDDFLDRMNLDRVELLLADIQGAEVDMLHGAQRSIAAGKIRFLFVSTHHHSISRDPLTHQKCAAFLREQGAHLLAAHTVGESYSGDGLLVASFWPQDRGLPLVSISHNQPEHSLFRELEYDLAEAWDRIAQLERLAAPPGARGLTSAVRGVAGLGLRLTRWLARRCGVARGERDDKAVSGPG